MKRFIEIQRSPYHGWNFCVGSIAEGLEDPANEIYPFIEYFGNRNTIFLVHYRNLLGGRYSFRETLPDEGDMDFHRVLKALKDTGYCYGIDPDHVPRTRRRSEGLLSVLCLLLRLHQCHDPGGLRLIHTQEVMVRI